MNISIERKEHTIATVTGRIDTLTANELENKVLPLITQGKPTLEINCVGVNYISSSGLRVFLIANKATKAIGGTVIITGLDQQLRHLFEVTGLTELFEFRY